MLLLRALRGWSFPGDLNQDGSLDSADLSALLAQWGAVGVNEADLDGSGVVDDQDLDLLSQRLDCAVRIHLLPHLYLQTWTVMVWLVFRICCSCSPTGGRITRPSISLGMALWTGLIN